MGSEKNLRTEEALARYLDGELEEEKTTILLTALEADTALADEIRRLLTLDDLLRQNAEPNARTFLDAVEKRLVAEEDGAKLT